MELIAGIKKIHLFQLEVDITSEKYCWAMIGQAMARNFIGSCQICICFSDQQPHLDNQKTYDLHSLSKK